MAPSFTAPVSARTRSPSQEKPEQKVRKGEEHRYAGAVKAPSSHAVRFHRSICSGSSEVVPEVEECSACAVRRRQGGCAVIEKERLSPSVSTFQPRR